MSPLSWMCSPHRRACRYTSALLVYSRADNERLHLSGPRLFLIAVYSNRRASLDAHSIAMRLSPNGAATLQQPVSSAKSLASYFDRSSFHSSTLP